MTARHAQSGFALVLVLWMLVLIGLLLSTLLLGGRNAVRIGANARAAAAAAAAADGAVQEAVFRLLARQWRPDGGPYTVRIGACDASVAIVDEAGRIDPNDAPHALLVALLVRLGEDRPAAEKLADVIALWRQRGAASGPQAARYQSAGLNWRPGGRAFRSPAELGQVIGMTPELLARLVPHLTVLHQGDVVWQAADPVVRAAIDDARKAGLVFAGIPPDPDLIVLIRADAHAVAGGAGVASAARASAQRSAEIRIRARPAAGEALFTVYEWR